MNYLKETYLLQNSKQYVITYLKYYFNNRFAYVANCVEQKLRNRKVTQ